MAARPEYASRIWCLILENTFTSIPDMAKVLIGWRVLQYLPLCFYKNKVLAMLCTTFYESFPFLLSKFNVILFVTVFVSVEDGTPGCTYSVCVRPGRHIGAPTHDGRVTPAMRQPS